MGAFLPAAISLSPSHPLALQRELHAPRPQLLARSLTMDLQDASKGAIGGAVLGGLLGGPFGAIWGSQIGGVVGSASSSMKRASKESMDGYAACPVVMACTEHNAPKSLCITAQSAQLA